MPKRNILFEAGPMLEKQKTGVGYYINHLVDSLQRLHGDEIKITGYYFNFLNRRKNLIPAGSQLIFHKIWLMPGKIISLCRRFGFQPWLELLIRQRAETIIFTNYVSLPQIRKRKTVLIIYDLSYLDVPQYTQNINLNYLRRFCSPSIRKADVVITISNFTKQRLAHHFPDLKADIVVTPIPPIFKQATQTNLSKNLINKGIVAGKYILYMGTIEPRKNLEALIDAYSLLSPNIRQEYSLVLAGGKGWKDESILTAVAKQQASGINIILPGYVSDDEKSALYSNANCFILPSHYEGFGMPILEAMQYRIPALISDIAVFHEVAGDAASYFDKDNPTDIAAKISLIITDQSLRQKCIEKGENNLRRFSWEANANAVFEALK